MYKICFQSEKIIKMSTKFKETLKSANRTIKYRNCIISNAASTGL